LYQKYREKIGIVILESIIGLLFPLYFFASKSASGFLKQYLFFLFSLRRP